MALSGDQKREYQRNWRNARRNKFLSEAGPCVKCGSRSDLEFDHIDAYTKVSHSIWSWSETRIKQELLKCQVLCAKCHLAKSRECIDGTRTLSIEDREDIRVAIARGESQRSVARRYNTRQSTIWNVLNRK